MRTEFPRITRNPAVMTGKPCIRGMRITVGVILGQLSAGKSVDDLLDDFPYLEREDILEALAYAASRISDSQLDLAQAA
jgi:uncharacterized protein (DUF433 family)